MVLSRQIHVFFKYVMIVVQWLLRLDIKGKLYNHCMHYFIYDDLKQLYFWMLKKNKG